MSRLTVNQHLARTIGLKRALYVETFVMLWAMYRAANDGEDPRTIEVFAESIGKSATQVYRWQVDFREAFAEWGWRNPADLLDYAARSRQVKRSAAVTIRGVASVRLAVPS